jgi:hypothetical protein
MNPGLIIQVQLTDLKVNMDLGIQQAAGLPIVSPLPASWLGRSDVTPLPPSWATIAPMSAIQTRNLLAQIAYKESGWDYNLVGAGDQLGRYQFSPSVLENYGLLSKGSVAAYGNDAVNYKHCWQSVYSTYENYFYNSTSLRSFLQNTIAQEHLANQYALDLYQSLVNVSAVTSTDSAEIVAGMIYVAWALGVGQGPSPSSSNGTGAWAWRYNNIGPGAENFNCGRYSIAILSR